MAFQGMSRKNGVFLTKQCKNLTPRSVKEREHHTQDFFSCSLKQPVVSLSVYQFSQFRLVRRRQRGTIKELYNYRYNKRKALQNMSAGHVKKVNYCSWTRKIMTHMTYIIIWFHLESQGTCSPVSNHYAKLNQLVPTISQSVKLFSKLHH